jgi:glyoxylase-like metal-dependent hydrolase (beta-lactamase superfamily II)
MTSGEGTMHPRNRRLPRRRAAITLIGAIIAAGVLAAGLLGGAPGLEASAASFPISFAPQPINTNPVLPENAVEQVSAHVYVIKGFPNIGIIVGQKATLVVDTGLGRRNGEVVARAARRASTHAQRLYLTTTHFHPEHASGQIGFPPDTIVIRNRVQQAELDADGNRMIGLFASGSAQMKSLLEGATVGKADILFDRAAEIDLGGVHARLLYFGAAHTRGDELTFVPEDSVLIPGDVVQNEVSPNFTCATCNPRSWIAVLDEVAKLHPQIIIPDHGGFGGESLIGQDRAFLADLQARASALKAQGVPVAQAGRQLQTEFTHKYPGWQTLQNLPRSVQQVYAERP